MSTPTYSAEQLEALREALAHGERRVSFGDKTIEYRSIEELAEAIRQVEKAQHHDAVATGLYPPAPRQIRLTTSKGT